MSRARTLTVRTVETIKPGPDRQEIPDRHLPGLYLVVQPSGAKSFAVRYRSGGRTRKHTLGSYPALDLKTARTLASQALRAIAEGRDPGHEKKARTLQADTVEAAVRLFVERHVLRVNRPNTAATTQRLLNTYVLPPWRSRRLSDVTRRDVRDLLDDIVDAGKPIAANRAFSAVRKFFNWTLERDLIEASPCAGVKPPSPARSRDRILADDELRAVWLATDELGYPFGALVQLLILTAARRDEVRAMRWSEVDLEAGVWTLPGERTKNGKVHTIPLSQAAIDILVSVPRINDRDFVFTTTGAVAWRDYTKAKHKLDELLPADTPGWVLHDLRRTAASGMARLGVNLPVIEKVLNHSSGTFAGVVGIYQRYDFATEKREALEIWARHVLALGEPNVVAFPAR
jgi:integrase